MERGKAIGLRGLRWADGWVAGALAIGLCLAAVSAALADGGVQQAFPLQAQAAVAAAVESSGDTYAGDCAETQSPRDLGGVCSKFVDSQNGVLAFETGMTFSEFTHWVFVTQADSGWQVVASVPLDDSSAAIPWPASASPAASPAG
jgi:hypothetical protein